ncbi:hypothetical protein [Cryptosporangium aurantiacum]|uniref:Uncharacterized protein n=1 Tax=Cryptosporangium aurantiacum TaxID=134849 RepID=A0A1M7QTQ1_9ACTN|nr:hypothetical protein [Cryptosporangium aurantiacum]SHN34776.1 hypothetical protein SAMN05443668_105306 [Cryptosporangium aurantiacum]
MAARHEPTSSRGGDRHDGGDASRRRSVSRHAAATTDPLYWARARAAEQEAALDRAGYDAGYTGEYDRLSDVTEELPVTAPEPEEPVVPEWSGRLPLPLGRPVADATTDSLPALRRDEDATTVDLPAVPFPAAETVDSRERPLALVTRRPERSALARRTYAGRHRMPEPVAPVRLGLSTVGMTVAVGVLGVTLAMLHAQPSNQADSNAPPFSAASPGATATLGPDGLPADGTEPTSGPRLQIGPKPATTASGTAGPGSAPGTTPGAARPGVAPAAPPAGDDGGTAEEPETRNPPPRPGNPGRTSRPSTASRPTPTCAAAMAADLGSVRARALAATTSADATVATDATTQADPSESPDETTEPSPEESAEQPDSSAAAGCP